MTIKQHIDAAIELIETLPHRGDRSSADRELSITVTHLEDAKMRLARGLAKAAGVFNEADLELPAVMERARDNHAVNAPGNRDGSNARS